MAIDWAALGQKQFDRIVEAVAVRLYTPHWDVRAIDGRGGDGGRDIILTRGATQRFAQLKYFPEGFTGQFSHRKRQIEDSWNAIRGGNTKGKRVIPDWPHGKPQEWIVAMPATLTPGELDYLRELVRDTGVRLQIWDRPWLDQRLAAHPDLHEYFFMDDSLESRARLLKAAEEGLASPDFAARIQRLGQVSDSIDPYWTWDFERLGDVTTQTLRAKHPEAAERSPIGITVQSAFGPSDSAVMESLHKALAFGFPDAVTLPQHVVQTFRVDGPPAFAEDLKNVTVTFQPIGAAHAVGKPIALKFQDAAGKSLATHKGVIEHIGSGDEGFSLVATFYGVTTISMAINETASSSHLEFTQAPTGHPVANTRKAIRLRAALHSSDSARIEIDGRGFGRLSLNHEGNWLNDEDQEFAELLEDLDAIERLAGVDFEVPSGFGDRERVAARSIRILLEGGTVQWPGTSAVTATLNGETDEAIEEMLSNRQFAIRVSTDPYVFTLFDVEIGCGAVSLWHPCVEVSDPAEHLAALRQGKGRGRQVEFKGVFGLFRLTKFAGLEPGTVLTTTPWGLSGIEEPSPMPSETADDSAPED